MSSTSISGTVAQLTLIRNECVVILKNSAGVAQAPLPMLTSSGNYNAMYSALLMASVNRYVVDLTADNSGITILNVHMPS